MLDFAKDFFHYFVTHKKYWLLPMFLIFLILGVFVALASHSMIAPFVYTLF